MVSSCCQVLLLPEHYGGCAQGAFGCTGSLARRPTNLRTAATLKSFSSDSVAAQPTLRELNQCRRLLPIPPSTRCTSTTRPATGYSPITTCRRWNRTNVRSEESLTAAYELLESAAATAYESVENLSGANRKVVLGVVHLIELAKALVDSALNGRGVEHP